MGGEEQVISRRKMLGVTGAAVVSGVFLGNSLVQASEKIPEEYQEQLDDVITDLQQRAINIRQPPYNAKGDGVTDDTEAIKAAIATGKDVYAPAPPVAYLLSDTLTLQEGQTYFGSGYSSVHQFEFVDLTRDYFLIRTANTTIRDLRVTCKLTGDTSNSSAIAMRRGAVNARILNTFVEHVPGNAYVAEEAIDCNLHNIISRYARRHGLYFTACDHVCADGFKIYNNKLESVVLRAKKQGLISGYKLKNGLIDGTHPETQRWYAIVLAQHPNQKQGERYLYNDIHIEKVTVRNTFSSTGYGSFFYNNGEPLQNAKFIDNMIFGSGKANAFDFRKCKNIDITGNVSYDSHGSAFLLLDCESVFMEGNSAYNPAAGGGVNHAGVRIDGKSNQIVLSKLRVIDDREQKLCRNAIIATGAASRVKVSGLTAEGMVADKIHFGSPAECLYGSPMMLCFHTDHLVAGQEAISAKSHAGPGKFVMSIHAYLRAITVHTDHVSNTGNAVYHVKKNDTVIETVEMDQSKGASVSVYLQPTRQTFAPGDILSIVYDVSKEWNRPDSSASILVSFTHD
ncbi:glycosyl hydrolase family 28-related protein [Paenibacillus sp. GYB004]|uniref:glycosyl hydrolase family 28-related protein n=1 Tax=Paenibacillus sp. GYB004 TaxID=2994393 RepID=UPI002F969200